MTEELNNDVRKLRFLDEDGQTYPDWEEKQLGEVAKRITRKNKGRISNRNLTISAQYGLIDQTEFFSKTVASSNNENYYLIKNGEFAYNKSYSKFAAFGATKKLTRYDMGVVSTLYLCFSIDVSEDKDFFAFLVDSKHWEKELANITVEGARNHGLLNVPTEDFFSMSISLPSLPEQTKIADFLSNLDERIEAQSKLVELLKKQKQGYSQRLFNGSLRFKKDDGTDYEDWEEKKLREVAELRNGYAFKSSDYKASGDYRVITIKNVSGSTYVDTDNAAYIQDKPKDLTAHQALKINDILVSLTGNVGRVSVVGEENLLLNQRVGLIETDKDLVNNLFLSIVLSFNRFENTMIKNGQGGAQKNISKGDVESYKISLPSLPEQEKIAAFLSSLDNRINQQLNKFEQLKQEKQAYIQRVLG